jgi:toxin ParE1/3/4
MRLEISEQAWRDISHIHHESFSQFGILQADKYVKGLLDLLDLIEANPNMAKVRAGFSKPTRLQRYKSHMIFYRVEGDVAQVVRVLHGKQNWSEYL